VINAQAGYDDPDSKSALSLLYNVFGPRIVEVGTSGIPDAYEEPVHRLDLVGSQGLGKHFSLRLKATNLLDWPVRETTGGEISQETRDGRSVGLTLGWTPI
jgi:outer membrane receptor protein involved in Fe transport